MNWQHSTPFDPKRFEESLSTLPESSGIFALGSGIPGSEPYINKAVNLRKRLQRLLSPATEETKRLNLGAATRTIEYTISGSDFENRLLLYGALRSQFPRSYRRRMKLIPAALVKIGWENEFPRAYFTRRLSQATRSVTADQNKELESEIPSASVFYGPFASKAAANKFLNDALDLFKSRRCTFNIVPDPAFPGCMYSEMKMCLAPCFAGCTRDQYIEEIGRVQEYLDTRAASLASQFETERDAASAQLDFEQAAALHARIEKVRAPWAGVPEIVGRIDRLRAIVVQRSALPDHVAVFDFHGGLLYGPVQFSVQGMQHANPNSGSSSLFAHPHMVTPVPLDAEARPAARSKPLTLEQRVLAALSEIETRKPERGEIADHLALLKRWHYRSSKKGEIFLTHSNELPLRRIVRGISRVFRGEKEETAESGDSKTDTQQTKRPPS